MSQTIPDESQNPTEQPTSADLLGKMSDATAALIVAQEKLVKAAADVAKHTTDPNAHGAATLANIAKALPVPVLEDGLFTFKDAAGKPLMEPVNIKGDPGEQGEKGDTGEKGDMPNHRWSGTSLQIQTPDGSWGEAQNLQGPKGEDGSNGVDGAPGLAPAHEWNGTALKFKNPDGTWGEEQNLQGPKGEDGSNGVDGAPGLAPAHEWDGTALKFKNPDGSWGEEQNLQGPKGEPGDAAVATDEQAGIVLPDGVTTTVDGEGLLSARGGNLLPNSDVWLTESGQWTAPVAGWYHVLCIAGGQGAFAYNGQRWGFAGQSGEWKEGFVYHQQGETVDVVVGAGGQKALGTSWNGSGQLGGDTSFGEITAHGGLIDGSADDGSPILIFGRNFATTNDIRISSEESRAIAPALGPGGTAAAPCFYGAGGGCDIRATSPTTYTIHNGYQGAVYLLWHDPAKAAGPLPAPALLSARRMAARAAAAPATVNLYDPETGQGSVWKAEDAEAKLAAGMISEDAWQEICDAKAAEDYATWLVDPATEAERFALLRAVRKVKLADYDVTVAELRRKERAGADVADALAAWDAYAEALCDLPAQEGAPWDGGGEATPWPEVPTFMAVEAGPASPAPEAAEEREEPDGEV